jgi:Flp pilus assembly protein TadD
LIQAPAGTHAEAVAILGEAATMCATAGDSQQAVDYLNRAVEMEPGNAQLQGRLGKMLLRVGEPRAARRYLVAAADASTGRDRAELLATAATATAAVDG